MVLAQNRDDESRRLSRLSLIQIIISEQRAH